jgi:hypothetical protein
MTELLNALVMRNVARRQLEAVRQSHGRNHWVCKPDRLARAVEIAPNSASQLGGRLPEL